MNRITSWVLGGNSRLYPVQVPDYFTMLWALECCFWKELKKLRLAVEGLLYTKHERSEYRL